MEFINHTRFPAYLFGGVAGPIDYFMCSIVARVAYSITRSGLVPAENHDDWLIHAGPWESPVGALPGDELFIRGGTDLIAWATCRPAPPTPGKPLTRTEVTLEGPGVRASIAVFGKRTWQRKGKDLVPSDPAPIADLPLSLANCFGGVDEWDGLQMPCVNNPIGKGYNHTDEHTEGRELPNIENPAALITSWKDQPEPVGLCAAPPFFPVKARDALIKNKDGDVVKINMRVFNAAFPALIAPTFIRPGSQVRLSGHAPEPLIVTLPSEGPIASVSFDGMRTEEPMDIDQVFLDAERSRVIITYRWPFRYRFYPMQKRLAEVKWPRGDHAGPAPKLFEEIEADALLKQRIAERTAAAKKEAAHASA